MSTKTHNAEYKMNIASHRVVRLVHGAYGHNHAISDTVLLYQSRAALLVNSASCLSACGYAQAGELKFH